MTYGATQSNSLEGAGLGILVAGLAALTGGWAYGEGIVQAVLIIVGVVGIAGGFATLHAARSTS